MLFSRKDAESMPWKHVSFNHLYYIDSSVIYSYVTLLLIKGKKFKCTAEELDAAWQVAKVVKFGGGFYCGLVSVKGQTPLYVFNAFFMVMRSKFVGDKDNIHCYEVQWEPKKLSWESFRGELLGPTDPKVSHSC